MCDVINVAGRIEAQQFWTTNALHAEKSSWHYTYSLEESNKIKENAIYTLPFSHSLTSPLVLSSLLAKRVSLHAPQFSSLRLRQPHFLLLFDCTNLTSHFLFFSTVPFALLCAIFGSCYLRVLIINFDSMESINSNDEVVPSIGMAFSSICTKNVTGMRSTQRSESMHAFIKGYLTSKSNLQQFVTQYDNCLANKAQQEYELDVASFNTIIPCATATAIEKQFRLC
ncbi:hypothetical protein Ahy_B01g056396 [Arachis hypogaea]|uniref:Protein FAR1-RELATED SEQUENCE n=1 Tax=Arachis hypogaea TaxID=3818 RepID=A0A445AYT7_ARAHY|nr:hypothetical protein Ahy_B01g056396 [Arachis hypogaea]